MSTQYTVDHFIAKFEAIPDTLWTTVLYTSSGDPARHCALGHCGIVCGSEQTEEAAALRALFTAAAAPGDDSFNVVLVNDCAHRRYQQPTPKARILAALRDIKAKQTLPPPAP